MRPARPATLHLRVALVVGLGLLGLLAAGLMASEASADSGFRKDTTPLPKSVSGSANADAADEDGGGGGGGGGGMVMRVVVGLVVVLAVIYGLQWLLRRKEKAKGLAGGDGSLVVVATAPLGQNRAVHLVRVGHELVLVGSGEAGVRALRVYDGGESERLAASLETRTTESRMYPTMDSAGEPGGRTTLLDSLRRLSAR